MSVLCKSCFIFFCCVCFCSTLLFSDDADIARHYFRQAQKLYDMNALVESLELVDTSLEFDPIYSDSLYLRSNILRRERGTLLEGLQELESAIRFGKWEYFDELSTQIEYGASLFLQGQFGAAWKIFEDMLNDQPDIPQPYLYLSRIAGILGDNEPALRFAEEGYRKFPDDPEIHLRYTAVLAHLGKIDEALRIVRIGMREKPLDLRFWVSAAEIEKNDQRKREYVGTYYLNGGTNPKAAVLGVESSLARDEDFAAVCTDIFIRTEGFRNVLLLEKMGALVGERPGLQKMLTGVLQEMRGFRYLDNDGNGFSEERYLHHGSSVFWLIDTDQNGRDNIEVELVENVPTRLLIRLTDHAWMLVLYLDYPCVDSVLYYRPDTIRHYRMIASAVVYDFQQPCFLSSMDGERFCYKHLFLNPQSWPREKEIKRFAYKILEYRDGRGEINNFSLLPSLRRTDAEVVNQLIESFATDLPFRSTLLYKGRRLQLHEDENQDGSTDRVVYFLNDLAHHGLADINFDGLFDTLEFYRNGKLEEIWYDENDDNNADFSMRFIPSEIRSWDHNSDGIDDFQVIAAEVEVEHEDR